MPPFTATTWEARIRAIYDDRVEVSSPGSLPFACAFACMRLAKHLGSGLPRVLVEVRSMRTDGTGVPAYGPDILRQYTAEHIRSSFAGAPPLEKAIDGAVEENPDPPDGKGEAHGRCGPAESWQVRSTTGLRGACSGRWRTRERLSAWVAGKMAGGSSAKLFQMRASESK